MQTKSKLSDNKMLGVHFGKFIMTFLLVLYSLVFHGCAPYSKLLDTQIEKTGKTKTRDSRVQKFAYSSKPDSEFLVKSGKVIFNLTQSVYDKDIGNEYKKVKVYENRYKVLPLHSSLLYEKPRLLLGFYVFVIGLDLALQQSTVTKDIATIYFAWDIFLTIIYLPSGGTTGHGKPRHRENYDYRDWSLDHKHTKIIPLANNSANISIPNASFNQSYRTDPNGEISVNLLQILRNHPIEDPMPLTVKCKFQNPGGNWQESSITISKKDVIKLISRL